MYRHMYQASPSQRVLFKKWTKLYPVQKKHHFFFISVKKSQIILAVLYLHKKNLTDNYMVVIALKHYIFLLFISNKKFRYAHNLTKLPNIWETEWNKTNRKCDKMENFLKAKKWRWHWLSSKRGKPQLLYLKKTTPWFELKVEKLI